LSVAEGGGSGVVEHVKEHERLLLDDKEDRVCEFPVCGKKTSEQLVIYSRGAQ